MEIFYIPQTQCGGYNDSYNLIHECNVKVQYLCSVKGIFLILKPICKAVKYLQPSYNCKDLVKRKWFSFYSWWLVIILVFYIFALVYIVCMLLIMALYGDHSTTSGYTLLLISPYFPREANLRPPLSFFWDTSPLFSLLKQNELLKS